MLTWQRVDMRFHVCLRVADVAFLLTWQGTLAEELLCDDGVAAFRKRKAAALAEASSHRGRGRGRHAKPKKAARHAQRRAKV